ncbi:hypothetical protein J8273_6619 [Carpediemonas membranifera]|uniref:Uncharacterized protein n=1 Tax=Carpediemonas membranifera TaxID=201153 RepID=A0A8J6AZ83_9EUKA|nr:hypothetical protein J8273_6619 [Carpediemonas membranifera]|eukprot:KAG9392028.1 hypothetical protein J8273_6619 [Carpediemonas membranifera]
MSFISAVKDQATADIDPSIALICIILNVVPIAGLGTLIGGISGSDSDIIVLGIVQMMLCIPWFMAFIVVAWIPFVGQVLYLAALATWLIVLVCNVIFGLYWGIVTYKNAAAKNEYQPANYAPMANAYQ